ncbi:MAG: phosphotransferase [Arcicella sp.]|jgi:thiamine kinase-like enzyme|nr:phosphotransferase [Arcicella sp.]
MKILSRYSVLEYLFWVNNNHYLVDDRNTEFCNLLSSDYKTLSVLEHDSTSRNIVFKFYLGSKSYFFKQFGPDLVKRKKYFLAEQFALNKINFSYTPKLVYQDKLANITITEELTEYKKLDSVLRELALLIPNSDISIQKLLKNIADVMKKTHQLALYNAEDSFKDYSEDSWHEFLSDKPELWGNELTTQFLKDRKKTHFLHYDLKGKNILISDNDNSEVKLLDWEMSEIGDPYYDLCFIIFEICVAFISPTFLTNKINNPQSINWAKKFINVFLDAYDKGLEKEKLNIFFKIIFFELKKNDFYYDNIDKCLPIL